jgi:hypothetical protein
VSVQSAKPYPLAFVARKLLAAVAQLLKRRQASQRGWQRATELVAAKVPAQQNTACVSPKCKAAPTCRARKLLAVFAQSRKRRQVSQPDWQRAAELVDAEVPAQHNTDVCQSKVQSRTRLPS